jgi:hypothetical protein
MNRLFHFRAAIDGYGLHFLHYRGRGLDPMPLLLMNGSPSSFVEYQRLAVLLSEGKVRGSNFLGRATISKTCTIIPKPRKR